MKETEMTTASENKVVFPPALRDMYPADAQKLYIEMYEQSWGTFKVGGGDLSRESVAARDAWDAVRREFVDDPVTHKWRRIGEQAVQEKTQMDKRSFRDVLRRMMKRS
jgi:cation transport regulator ChaB